MSEPAKSEQTKKPQGVEIVKRKTFEPLPLKRRKLGKLMSYRLEMHDIWRAMKAGLISTQEGTQLIRAVNDIRRARLEEDQLKLMEKGGIVGVPFVGVAFVKPEPVTNGHDEDEPLTIEHQPTNGHANGQGNHS